MPLISKLAERLKRHPKRVVFPEGSDARILQAARKFATRGLGIPILIGERAVIKANAEKLNISLEHIRIIDPKRSDEFENFVTKFQGLRRFKGLNQKEAAAYVENSNYFATLMLATAQADAIVSGATSSASSALRPLLQIIPRHDQVSNMSSLNIFDLEDPETGKDRELFLADCAVIPDPTSEQLCDIAVTTAALSYHLTNVKPRVALLSYTSKSMSSKNPTVAKMKAATELARRKAIELGIPMEIDGELQVDAALDPIVAKSKQIEGTVAGQANVLIFPDLHSANIASKLVDILTRARNYGPILTGLTKPAAEISRGATASDIFGTAVMVASQAIDHKLLYPTDGDDLNEDVTKID
ncbi:phosphate acyltransferase [Coraliomargarita akajimensis]|uniref:Phosphate acetyl/butaryl transferase n=1 Tax=Coraliomargarita akajimensis (strain DSM 45221 / IAM 15411 / JCM 23193 / KCTC 12865 / 04OKA010-24) TaxID=583355 RepID=D5EHN0_CORAD|nr:phosphate acyltransferase [Coraliomargarita akajimensis]ADE54071.1 phosphate acetyl/butaryl transferase [Coraliomargarita akajimensis DSM 45221]